MCGGFGAGAPAGGDPRTEGIAVDPAKIDMPPGEARFSAGEVINYTVYAASGVVNSIGAVPSAAA
jgi:hypothetical protein